MSATQPSPVMIDQVVDAKIARRLYVDALRKRGTAAWIVFDNEPAYPDKLLARLVTTEATPYVLLADTIVGLRRALPFGLDHAKRQPADPQGVVEIWFAPSHKEES